MSILLTGCDGYMGWPLMLALAKAFPDEKIVGLDNDERRGWVKEVGAESAVPISPYIHARQRTLIDICDNARFKFWDLTDTCWGGQCDDCYTASHSDLAAFMKKHKPRIIIHAAAQPSAPYSHIDGEHAAFTQRNNNQATTNLLWAAHEHVPDCLFIGLTTTGVYGAPPWEIPEGYLGYDETNIGESGYRETFTYPHPHMAGSFYHMSKANDCNSYWIAAKLWGMDIIDCRTSIVVGTRTREMEGNPELATRLDYDKYFGVVAHRFAAQAVAGRRLTVYGKGEQLKPFISLQDSVDSIVNMCKSVDARGKTPPGSSMRPEVVNQMTDLVSIVTLAKDVADAVNMAEPEHIPNPRIEDETHQMRMANDQFMQYLPLHQHYDLSEAIEETIADLTPHADAIRAQLEAHDVS